MRLIALATLSAYWTDHPETRVALQRWSAVVRAASWQTTADVKGSFATAKVLDGERVRFDIAGGDYRLIVSFKFRAQIAFVKFIGTHAQYDRVDALKVSLF